MSTIVIVNCIVTRMPLKEKLVLLVLTVLFKLSAALEEEILKAGIILKVTLRKKIIIREISIKTGELVNFWL
jgi:hypothetical protein